MAGADFIAPESEKEINALTRSGRWGLSRILVIVFITVLLLGALGPLIQKGSREHDSLERIENSLLSSGNAAATTLVESERSYQDWLARRAYGFESTIFKYSATLLLRFASYGGIVTDANPLSFSSLYLLAVSGLLRVLFMLVASWRIWSLAIAFGFIWNYTSRKAHVGADLLGQTGNGRLFFSGIRAGLENLSAKGAPDKHVVGLVALRSASRAEVVGTELYKLLQQYRAANDTNVALAAHILHYKDVPAHIAVTEEENLLSAFFDTQAKLADCALLTLRKCLALHAAYRGEGSLDGDPLEINNEKLDLVSYADVLEGALHRVLTASLRDSLAEISPEQVATLVLSAEAGKIMTFAHEGGRWIRRSAYPQLNARAVLHSVPSFGEDYDYDIRTNIRRGLIYADRNSGFGPVRFPVDLSDESRALRQWAELLMAVPHRLQSTADEVELYGIVCETQARWQELFLSRAMALDAETVDDAFASRSNLLFLPIKKVVSIMREVIDPAARRRLEELVACVNQRQKLEIMSREFSAGGADASEITRCQERILAPLSYTEQKELAAVHGLSIDEIRDWSSFRVVLESFSWLGRRVGDYTVPPSSVIFGVFKVAEGTAGRNEYGFVGMPGMVALRGSRLEERWGKFWSSRFMQADNAKMAESREDFEKLLKGISDVLPDEAETPPAVGQ